MVPLGPSACDLMDRRHLSLAREGTRAFYDRLIPAETEAALLVELEGDSMAEVRDTLAQIIDRVRRKKRLAFHALQTQDRAEVEWYGGLAQKVVPTLYRMKGSTPAAAVHRRSGRAAARRWRNFWCACRTCSSSTRSPRRCLAMPAMVNCTCGRFSTWPIRPTWRNGCLATTCTDEVLDVGGTISGEHAAGLSRTAFIRQQYGPLGRRVRGSKADIRPAESA